MAQRRRAKLEKKYIFIIFAFIRLDYFNVELLRFAYCPMY